MDDGRRDFELAGKPGVDSAIARERACAADLDEATFDDVWGGFYCYFDSTLIETVKGKAVTISVGRLVGAKSKIELVVGANLVGTIFPTQTKKSISYTFPSDMTSAYIRAVVYGAEDMHCEFEGISMKLK